jgi:hypothetical protein
MAAQAVITRVCGYSASKAAIDSFTRWLAVELAKKLGEKCALYDSTFSRTVWRLYDGAKGLVMWYYEPAQHGNRRWVGPQHCMAAFRRHCVHARWPAPLTAPLAAIAPRPAGQRHRAGLLPRRAGAELSLSLCSLC